MDDWTMLRFHSMYQRSWTGWKCDHQTTPRMLSLPEVGARSSTRNSGSSPRTSKTSTPQLTSRSKTGMSPRATVTLDPLSYRRTRRLDRQKPWVEQTPRTSPKPDRLEIHYETFLPSNKELEYRAREYVTNPRYGHLYEVRETRPKPAPKDNRVISWFWENQFQLWRQEMDSNKGKTSSSADSLSARVKNISNGNVSLRRVNSFRQQSETKPHADLFAAYHNQLLVNQRRQVAATVVQRHFRGWRTRMRLSRLKRRALLELGRPWPKVVQDLRQLVSRVQARHGVMRTGSRFTLSDLEEYVDRRQKYERTFEKLAPDGKLSRDQLAAFVNECEHYPTEGELNDAFNSVFKGSSSTAEVVFVLDCSTSVDAISFNDQMTFVKDVVRCLHVAPHRVRVGVVPYNTDVFQSFGLLQHSSGREVIEAVDKIQFRPGLTLTDKGLRIMRDIFKDARPGVQKVAVVITDGQSADRKQTILEAKRAREENITIFAIGVGRDVERAELEDIAGDVSRVSLCSDYHSLIQLKHTISTKLCLPACVLCQHILPRLQMHGLYKSEALEVLYMLSPSHIYKPAPGFESSSLESSSYLSEDDKPSSEAPPASMMSSGGKDSSGRRHNPPFTVPRHKPSVDRPDQDKKIKIADDSNDDRSEEFRGLETAMSSSTKSCDHKNSLNSPVGGANARDVIWTLFPPSAAGLLPKKSRWIRPLVDGKEAWSLLDDDIIKATDFKVCLGLVIKAKLEREGVITLPSDLRAGVEEVTSYEEAMQKIEQYIEKRKREKDPVMANL